MNKKKINAIIKELEKEKKCVYPFLELTAEEIEYLKSKNVTVDYEFIKLHHFLADGTYKKLATVLELKEQLKENTYCTLGTIKGFSTITADKIDVQDGTIQCKVDVLEPLRAMSDEVKKALAKWLIEEINKVQKEQHTYIDLYTHEF